MVPYWLKPNKSGVVFLVIFAILLLYLFSFLDIILVNNPLLLIAFSMSVAYPISMFLGMKVGKKMKILLGVILIVMSCFFLFSICPFCCSFAPNIGLPFSYYGKFNRVKYRLKRVSGIRILRYRQHKDFSLEDFRFIIQTEGGLNIDLEFSHVAKTYELFDHADGLAVRKRYEGNWILYPFGPNERLESAIGKEIRNAVHVLENFKKIAEVVESDRQKGVLMAGWGEIPNGYFHIRLPSLDIQTIK